MVKLIQLTAAGSYGQQKGVDSAKLQRSVHSIWHMLTSFVSRIVSLSLSFSALTSVLILLFNKIILTTYSFKYPFTMALSHMVVGLILLHGLKTARIITYAPFDWMLARKALPVSLCFIANCVLGMVALKGTNIPMFATLRRLTVMMVVMCEVIVLRKKQTMLIVISVTVMVLGSFIGGWGDLQFDLFGYSMVLLNNLVTALNLVFIKKTLMDTKLASDTFGVLYYNSLLSIPFLLIFVVLSGEILTLSEFPYLLDSSFQTSFLLSACMSFLMNYSTYWCTEVNSALTTSVTGQVKNVISSFVSLGMFGHGVGVQATPMLIAGLTVGLTGSFMYAYAVYKQDQNKQKKEVEKRGEIALAQSSAQVITSLPSSTIEDGLGGGGTQVDENLSLLTGGVVNGLHSSKAAERHQHTTQVSALSNGFHHSSSGGDSNSLDSEADAKLLRLEAGQRSPMVGMNSNNVPLVFPTSMLTPSNRNSVPSSPNPQHPYNQPHKSKPN